MCMNEKTVNDTLKEVENFINESKELTESSLYHFIKGGMLNQLPRLFPDREKIAETVANTTVAHFRMGVLWKEMYGHLEN